MAACIRFGCFVSLRSKRFLARFVYKAGTRAKKKNTNDGGGAGERRNLQPFFCFRSNFRAITRLETLATQATVLSVESSIPQTNLGEKICHFCVSERANGRWNLVNPSAYALRMSRKNQYIVTTTYKTGELSTKQTYIGVDLSNDLDWSHHHVYLISRTLPIRPW